MQDESEFTKIGNLYSFLMKNATVALAATAWFISGGEHSAAAKFQITRDGAESCVLVIAGELSPSEKTGIKEFTQFVAEMSGVQLQTKSAEDAGDGPKIVIGAEAVKKLHPKVDLSGLGDEGFLIQQEEKDLLVVGGKLRGTMYGIYTVLEDLGCRWWTNEERLIPKKKTLEVSIVKSRQVPFFLQRNIMYADITGEWAARNKINKPGWGEIDPKYGGAFETVGPQGHNLFLLMKEAGVAVEDEMLCLWKGKRDRAQLCLTDPRVMDGLAKALVKIAKTKPEVPYVVLAVEDNHTYCECPRCAEVDAKAGSHSGQLVACVNPIAKILAKEAPGTDLMFYAYQWTRKPPANMTLEPNVTVAMAFIESNYMRPLAEGHVAVNASVKDDLAGWGKLSSKFFVWDYVVNYNNFNLPFPNLDVLAPNVKFFADHNVRFFMEQAAHTSRNAEFAQLRSWVLAKSMWNPEANNQDLISDFLNHYYGPAAPAIQEYIDITHKPGRTTVFKSDIYDRLNAPYLAPEIIAAAEVALLKAEALAKGNPDYERRVRHAHMPVWHVIAHRPPGGPTWKAIEKATGKPVDLTHIAAQLKQILVDRPKNKNKDYGDSEPLEPWIQWLEDYASRLEKNGGKKPLPPELKDVDPATYTLIQACQMDCCSRWWQKSDAGDSDGWSIMVSTPAWLIRHYLMAGEDFTPGKKYEFYVRIKPGKILSTEGRAFTIGDNTHKINCNSQQPEWDISKMKSGEWQTIKIGELELQEGDWFFFAANPSVLREFELDCYWLKEIPN